MSDKTETYLSDKLRKSFQLWLWALIWSKKKKQLLILINQKSHQTTSREELEVKYQDVGKINKINNLKERIMKDIFKKSDNKKELIDGLEKDEK